MWLPTRVYERIPHFLLAVGVVFMLVASYLTPAYPRFSLYFGAGLVCVLWGAGVLVVRARSRQRGKSHSSEQTSGQAD